MTSSVCKRACKQSGGEKLALNEVHACRLEQPPFQRPAAGATGGAGTVRFPENRPATTAPAGSGRCPCDPRCTPRSDRRTSRRTIPRCRSPCCANRRSIDLPSWVAPYCEAISAMQARCDASGAAEFRPRRPRLLCSPPLGGGDVWCCPRCDSSPASETIIASAPNVRMQSVLAIHRSRARSTPRSRMNESRPRARLSSSAFCTPRNRGHRVTSVQREAVLDCSRNTSQKAVKRPVSSTSELGTAAAHSQIMMSNKTETDHLSSAGCVGRGYRGHPRERSAALPAHRSAGADRRGHRRVPDADRVRRPERRLAARPRHAHPGATASPSTQRSTSCWPTTNTAFC